MEATRQVFALDIGTRTVIGLLMKQDNKGYRVVHSVVEEHPVRSMLDGQIHEIPQVAKVVKSVKQKLEKRSGQPLQQVAVAAAGRSLKTVNMKTVRDISPLAAITPDLVRELELEAVQEAQKNLVENAKRVTSDFHCVGYSVLDYVLDGNRITNPAGQFGHQISVEVIATFLPRVVVDSLFAVLETVGLEMASLTLEPIAAINVIIPSGMRKLNLALIDIGAGTSDIAVTSNGTITAYAMVPVAGDEVTEKLCDSYLLDFKAGEKLKRELKSCEKPVFIDILGQVHDLPSDQVINTIAPVVNSIARDIVSTILGINRKPPQAVVCVGGGSLTPGLTTQIANLLDLPESRVGIRSPGMIAGIYGVNKLSGPEWVTPVGIAAAALNEQSLNFSDIYVNKRPTRIFETKNGNVGDALLAAGINIRHLSGRPGLALTVEVNGQMQVLKGTMGQPAAIQVNSQPASTDTPIQKGDYIEITPPVDGEPGKGLIQDVIPQMTGKRIRFGGKLHDLSPVLLMNGEPVSPNQPLADGCKITYQSLNTACDLLKYFGMETAADEQSIVYTINGETGTHVIPRYRLFINGKKAGMDAVLITGDEIEYGEAPLQQVTLREIIITEEFTPQITEVFVNGLKIVLETPDVVIRLNGMPARPDDEVHEGDVIEYSKGTVQPILADVLPLITLPPYPSQQTATLVTTINGKTAEFTSVIKTGDKIRIMWK